ncbi:MAG: hypothetical protein FWD12_13190 [Alphaproteobacteria bacterium]|nr:hypothetical protein [Alphaproteobacteria bacterium]
MRSSPLDSRPATPRALLHRQLITIEVTPVELHTLVVCLEGEAQTAIERGQDCYADFLLCRVAEIREAAR